MTPDEELERELASYRPRPASANLQRRIAMRLNRRRIVALVGTAAVAAGVVIAPLLNRPTPPVNDLSVVELPRREIAPAPSLLAYHHAVAKSPQAFEAMLDRQAVRSAEPLPPVRAGLNLLTLRGPRE